MSTKVSACLLISGRVQGVFYRQSTKQMAHQTGLDGWVRNCADGRVEALFSGPRSKVEEAIDWCRQGPPAASVENVKVTWLENHETASGFRIRY